MLCNYLNNIYSEHIQSNLIDDEVKYNYIIKDKIIDYINEYHYVGNFPSDKRYNSGNEIIYFNKEYKIGFTYNKLTQHLWIVHENSFLPKVQINRNRYFLNLFKDNFPETINGVSYFNDYTFFYKDAVSYLKHNYVV